MSSHRSTSIQSVAHPELHSFVMGVGFVSHDEPLPRGRDPTNRCYPRSPAADGSLHQLWPPYQGVSAMTFAWHPDRSVWTPSVQDLSRSKRLGFTAEYLSSHGWRYGAPSPRQEGRH